jgi:tryptophanyl-tRNA synthetase
MKPVLVSGIQPTGKLHIGNYLGVLQNFIDLQNSEKYECFFFIADLHSLTEGIDTERKREQIRETATEVCALGLESTKTTFFLQSAVPAHAELAVILNNLTPFSELQRMTQFKDKSKHQAENINVGLFDYPVLMAADILLYDTEVVPVGEDQLQHLELTRTLARKFNSKFGKTFIEPKARLSKTPRIMSLDDPTKKMSKSRPSGCIYLSDSATTIKEKVKRAVTDSGNEIFHDIERKPAISNLLQIFAMMRHTSPEAISKEYLNKGYAVFKNELAQELIELKEIISEQRGKLHDRDVVPKILANGNKKANIIASRKLREVKERIGLSF